MIICCSVMNDTEQVEKYYLMGAKKGLSDIMMQYAMLNKKRGNIILMKKYAAMAFEYGTIETMPQLLHYYSECWDSRWPDANKCQEILDLYLNNKIVQASVKRSCLIQTINNYSMLNNCDTEMKHKFMNFLIEFEFKESDKLNMSIALLISTAKSKISLIKLHYEHTINGKGYNEAKEDFINRCML